MNQNWRFKMISSSFIVNLNRHFNRQEYENKHITKYYIMTCRYRHCNTKEDNMKILSVIIGISYYRFRIPYPDNVIVSGNQFWLLWTKSSMPLNIQDWAVIPIHNKDVHNKQQIISRSNKKDRMLEKPTPMGPIDLHVILNS